MQRTRPLLRKNRTALRPKAGRRVHMADIAKLAGVSTATVSRALNRSMLVNSETRERVEEIARSLNYTMTAPARRRGARPLKTIAVVVPSEAHSRRDVSDPFFLTMLGSIADALTERGFDMLLSRIDAEQLEHAVELYDGKHAAGLIFVGQWRQEESLSVLTARSIPLVVWGAHLRRQTYCVVGCDNIAGGELATGHLLDSGASTVVFLGDTSVPEVANRFEGYRNAHAQRGIKVRSELVVPVPFVADSAHRAVVDLIARRVQFDAVFACSDVLALSAIQALREAKRTVPDDVSVVGYDDIELAAHCHPALSTIRQPIATGGRALVASLLAILDGQKVRSTVLRTELVVRDSSRLPAIMQAVTGTGGR